MLFFVKNLCKMEYLPDEILLDVFRHAKHDWDQVKQVCKRFYLLNCQLNKNKSYISISDKQVSKNIYKYIICENYRKKFSCRIKERMNQWSTPKESSIN